MCVVQDGHRPHTPTCPNRSPHSDSPVPVPVTQSEPETTRGSYTGEVNRESKEKVFLP